MYSRIICTFILMLGSVTCEAQTGNYNKQDKNSGAVSVCLIVKNLDKEFALVNTNAKEIITTEENDCLAALLDSIKMRSIKQSDPEYLAALDSMAKYCSGIRSEYFDNIAPEIFYGNFDLLIDYLIGNEKSYLKYFLIGGLSLKIGLSDDREKERKEIEEYINGKIEKRQFSDLQKKSVRLLFEEIL